MQEEIPERTSSEGRHGRDDDDPQEIQPPATRREHAAHREDGNAHKVEEIKDHTSSHNAERRRSAAAGSGSDAGADALSRRLPAWRSARDPADMPDCPGLPPPYQVSQCTMVARGCRGPGRKALPCV